MRSLLIFASSSARIRGRVPISRSTSARTSPFSSLPAEERNQEEGDDERERDEDGASIARRRRATIIAPATSTAQAAAVAVLRVSGPNADAVLRGLLPRGQPLPEPRVATLVKLLKREQGRGRRGGDSRAQPQAPPRLLDRALALRFPGPKSYTGEDVVELHVHGGTAVVSAVMEAALEVGSPDEREGGGGAGGGSGGFAVRVARPGEFTRRAFESGKVDLAAAEGIADLIAAADDASAASAAALADGRLSGAARRWRREAVELLAAAEAAAEFEDDPAAMTLVDDGGDEKSTASVASGVSRGAALLADALDDALAAAAASRVGSSSSSSSSSSASPRRVSLLGLPNAGKSSLLNALTRTESAIVTGEPGTTRDVLEATVELRRERRGGRERSSPSPSPSLTVVVCDTAGVRDSSQRAGPGSSSSEKQQPLHAAEAEGVRRALEAAAAASVVVLVVDGERLSAKSSSGDDDGDERQLKELAKRALRSNSDSSLIVAVNKCDAIGDEVALERALAAARRVAAEAGKNATAVLPLSAATGQGLGALVDALRIAVAAASASHAPPPPSFSTPPLPLHTERHRAALAAASTALRRAAALGGSGGLPLPSPELVAEELREAVSEIGALSAGGGKGGTTNCDVDGEVLDAVFARFCVGK